MTTRILLKTVKVQLLNNADVNGKDIEENVVDLITIEDEEENTDLENTDNSEKREEEHGVGDEVEGEDKDMNVKEEQNGVELLCEEVEEPFKLNISEEVIDEYLIEENQEKEKLELEETSKLNTTELPLDPKRYVEKKYVCSICGFRNINKWRLKRHFESCRRKFEKYNPGAAAHEGVMYP